MDKMISTSSVKLRVSAYAALALAVLIGTHGLISGTAAAVTMTNNQREQDAQVQSADKEIQRRLDALKTSSAALENSSLVPDDLKTTALSDNKKTQQTLTDLQQKLKSAKTSDEIKTQTSEVEKQYAQFQISNVKTTASTNAGSQTQAKDDLTKTADTVQAQINQAKSDGQDTDGSQDALEQIKKLIESVIAVIASVAALITSLLAGDILGAVKIMESIVAQLGINSSVIASIGEGLSSLSGSLQIG